MINNRSGNIWLAVTHDAPLQIIRAKRRGRTAGPGKVRLRVTGACGVILHYTYLMRKPREVDVNFRERFNRQPPHVCR